MFRTGNTTTTQMSQKELAVRFLLRTLAELAPMRACLPDTKLPIEPLAMSNLGQLAAKVSSAAEAFGFPEIAVITGSIELLSQVGARHDTLRERLELATRLTAQLSALEVHVEYELAERDIRKVPGEAGQVGMEDDSDWAVG